MRYTSRDGGTQNHSFPSRHSCPCAPVPGARESFAVAGLLGLAAWSFVMATVHGAGMMLVPVLMPLVQAGEHAGHMPATASLGIAALAVLAHSLAMLVTTGAVALAVYEWVGLDFLRRGWINLDLIWAGALIGMGLWLLLAA